MRSKAEFRNEFVKKVGNQHLGLVLHVLAGLSDPKPDHRVRNDGIQRFQQ